ncbi:MAG: CocE/NonD family hydrolase [Anaerolineae bacterium]
MENKPSLGHDCRILRNVQIAMRDGVLLATTIYLPLNDSPSPVVLVRTAYNRSGLYDSYFPRHGMALVVQDCRGRYGSLGEHYPFANETDDGYDTLEWIGRQPWCNGRVGMYGDSYLAATQFAAVRSGHSLLKAVTPRFMAGDCWKRAYYVDGVFSLALTWSWLCFEVAGRTSDASAMPLLKVADLLRTLPIAALDEASGVGRVPSYRAYVEHSRYDALWQALNISSDYPLYRMPALFVGGWYDNYAQEAVNSYQGVRDHAPSPELAASHRLLIGPWTHGINSRSVLGEIDFGAVALAENDATQRWLDCILHERDPRDFQASPIRLFVMGINRWRDEYEWPLARTRYVNYYLRADGRLSPAAPSESEQPDHYTYDPADPAPTLGGNHSVGPYNPGLYELAKPGPYDQRPNESRPDFLVYTSDPLAKDTEVTGPVRVTLYASSSAPDTDFVARLTDVFPDGRSINITEGVIRARFREDVWGTPRLMEPGTVYAFTIDLQVTSNVFLEGHRIRVDITSSNFPLWDRNLNTGNDPGSDKQMVIARQTIWHTSARSSSVILPIIDG